MTDRKPIARLSMRRDKQTYGILTIWPGKFPGTYDISRDKGSERYPAIGFLEAVKAWTAGDAYLSISVESQREKRGGPAPAASYDDDGFGEGSVPF